MKKQNVRRQSIRKRREQQRLQLIIIFSTLLLVGSILLIMQLFNNQVYGMEEVNVTYLNVTVQPDDTLWDFATTYNTSNFYSNNDYIKIVKKMNGLTSTKIYVGEQLTLPIISVEFSTHNFVTVD